MAASPAGLGAEGRTALANLVWKAVSLPLDKGCRALLLMLSGSALGTAAFGRFQFLMTVTTLMALGTDLGLGIWTTRALARSRERAAGVVRTALGLRSLVAVPYLVVTLVAAAAAGTAEMRAATLLLGAAALAGAYVDHFAAVLRGYERLDDEAWLNVGRSLLMALLGLGALAVWGTLVALAAGVAAGTLLGAAYGMWMLRRRYRLLLAGVGTFDRALAREAAREAVPLWVASLLSMLYFKGDILLLRPLAGDAELGAYAAAYKFFEGSMILPSILLAAVFPPLARAHGDRVRQGRWERLVVAALLGVGVAVGAGLYFGAEPLVRAVYGAAFARSVPSLCVLALGVPLLFFNYGLTHFLIARDLGMRNLLFGALMLVVNVALNLALIPRAGGPGAAVATVLTELFLTACCLVALGWAPWRTAPRRPSPAPSGPPPASTGHTSA